MNRSNPPQERAVIRILARIDLHIRRRWWRNYVDNPTWSFSKSIIAAEALADNQWSFDYAPTLYQGYQGGQTWEPNPRWEPRVPGSPKKTGKVKVRKVRAKEWAEAKALKELAGQT